MFCSNCGKQIEDKAAVCVYCGAPVGNYAGRSNDAPSGGFAVLGFFIPIVGFILYLVNHSEKPLQAKSAGKGALIGFITRLVVYIALIILYIVGVSSMFTGVVNDINDDGCPAFAEQIIGDKTDEILKNSLDVSIGDFVIEKGAYFNETKLNVTVKNKAEGKRSFYITIEAVDETGARLQTDMIYADNLNSGQEMRLTAFEYVDPEKLEEFKGASFKVLEVSMY